MDDPKPMNKFDIEEHTGWHEQGDGKWFLGVPIMVDDATVGELGRVHFVILVAFAIGNLEDGVGGSLHHRGIAVPRQQQFGA